MQPFSRSLAAASLCVLIAALAVLAFTGSSPVGAADIQTAGARALSAIAGEPLPEFGAGVPPIPLVPAPTAAPTTSAAASPSPGTSTTLPTALPAANISGTAGVVRHGATLKATGRGVAPAGIESPTQARLMAQDAAQMDAERALAAALAGVRVQSSRSAIGGALQQDHTHQTVDALLRGCRVVDVRHNDDGITEVDVEISL